MFGIVVEYEYSGDEGDWQGGIDGFIAAINGDERLDGRFSYMVNVKKDGIGRIHVGQWDDEETLAHLQSQDYFKDFAAQLKGFAGDSLKPSPFNNVARSNTLSVV